MRVPSSALGVVVGVAIVTSAAGAVAHPMGTLSTNRAALLELGEERTSLRYFVDFAEIPAAAEARRLDEAGAEAWALARMAELLPALTLTVDGAPLPLTLGSCAGTLGAGEGGLPVVLLYCTLSAPPITAGRLLLADGNFRGTPGWRQLHVAGAGVAVGEGDPAASVSARSPSLPFEEPEERMRVERVEATVGVASAQAPAAPAPAPAPATADPLVALLTGGSLSPGLVLFALLSASLLGAGHALSPGHGKTIVAAYLVGARGTVGHALLLGLTVTATHVSSVLLLGLVALLASEHLVVASLHPWIGVLSGLGVVGVGAGLLHARLRSRPGDGGHDHAHAPRGEAVSLRRLLLLGVTGGAVPCPSALVVLLAAVALHRIAFGLLLIVAFSAGLAVVLVTIGVLVVRARALLDRLGRLDRAAPVLSITSACIVIVLGATIALQSAREGGLF